MKMSNGPLFSMRTIEGGCYPFIQEWVSSWPGPVLGAGCWGYINESDMVPPREDAWFGGGL